MTKEELENLQDEYFAKLFEVNEIFVEGKQWPNGIKNIDRYNLWHYCLCKLQDILESYRHCALAPHDNEISPENELKPSKSKYVRKDSPFYTYPMQGKEWWMEFRMQENEWWVEFRIDERGNEFTTLATKEGKRRTVKGDLRNEYLGAFGDWIKCCAIFEAFKENSVEIRPAE